MVVTYYATGPSWRVGSHDPYYAVIIVHMHITGSCDHRIHTIINAIQFRSVTMISMYHLTHKSNHGNDVLRNC